MILLSQDFKYEMLSWSFCDNLVSNFSSCVIPFSNPAMSIGFFVFCFFCLLLTIITLKVRTPSQQIKVKEVKHIPADLMNYVLPYVVSFMSIQYSEVNKFVGFLIFLGWLFWLSYKSGQVVLNPILIALGWKLYEVKYSFVGSANELLGKALSRSEFPVGAVCTTETIQDIIIKKE